MATETPTKPQVKPKAATFMTQGHNTVLERTPPQEVYPPRGGAAREIPGTALRYKFTPAGSQFSRLDLPFDKDVLPVIPEDPDGPKESAVEWVRRHEHVANGRVWEIDPEAPDPSELLGEIGVLAAKRDEDAIAEVLATEQGEDGWQREPVIRAATDALHAIEAATAPPPPG